MSNKKTQNEAVVLLHGMLKNRFKMAVIARHLRKQGYDTINISYPSRRMNINQLANFIEDRLKIASAFNNASKVHFVAHSMGGLITRYLLQNNRPDNLGQVIMLATPNQGSECADFLMNTRGFKRFFNWLCGPAGAQLHTDYKHTTSETINFPLGIIAGNASANPFAPWLLGKQGTHDGIVSIERTKIKGMTDLIILPTSHLTITYSAEAKRQTAYFLKHERFDHKP